MTNKIKILFATVILLLVTATVFADNKEHLFHESMKKVSKLAVVNELPDDSVEKMLNIYKVNISTQEKYLNEIEKRKNDCLISNIKVDLAIEKIKNINNIDVNMEQEKLDSFINWMNSNFFEKMPNLYEKYIICNTKFLNLTDEEKEDKMKVLRIILILQMNTAYSDEGNNESEYLSNVINQSI
jgi:hypothetical protein